LRELKIAKQNIRQIKRKQLIGLSGTGEEQFQIIKFLNVNKNIG